MGKAYLNATGKAPKIRYKAIHVATPNKIALSCGVSFAGLAIPRLGKKK
jgi:hypothetical protein